MLQGGHQLASMRGAALCAVVALCCGLAAADLVEIDSSVRTCSSQTVEFQTVPCW